MGEIIDYDGVESPNDNEIGIDFDAVELIPFDKCDYKMFEMRKKFDLNTRRINSLDISTCGNYMVTSDDDDKLTVFDILQGCEIKVVLSKKYGCDHVMFTKGDFNALHTSTKINNIIRYLSLENKAYIRYFDDHKDTVLSLSISSHGKQFLSSSKDGTIKLWDIRSHNCCGTNYNHINPKVAYDPFGKIFAVTDDTNSIKLYDSRALDCQPFKTFEVKSSKYKINNIKFSPNGRTILIGTNGNYFYTYNAFTGEKKRLFEGINNPDKKIFGLDFSPCSTHILASSNFGELHLYNAENGHIIRTFKSSHTGIAEKVVFHESYFMLITAETDLIWWTPDYDDDIFSGCTSPYSNH